MSKALKIAAIVVGVAALAFTGVGLVMGASWVAATTIAGVGFATITTALSVGAAALSLLAGVTAKKPKVGSAGQQLEWSASPTAGNPYVVGNAMVGMDVVHQASWGDKNKNLGVIGVISAAGPIQSYDGFYADGTQVTFSGGAGSGNATGYYNNFMFLTTQLGNRPEGAALSMPGMPDWGAAYKLSGLAAAGVTLVADVTNGKIFSGGTPQMTHLVHGVKAYDARGDGTNGGSGAQRARDEATYLYSDNPWVHHGTFAIGRWENGVRTIGPGMPVDSIDWPSHIEAANVADANGWKISGKVYSTDNKWEVLKAFAQAGGGYPVPSGTKLAALVNTPRVAVETIRAQDVKGSVSAPQMAMRRERFNSAIPRYREPTLGWQIVAADTIRNPAWIAEDGGIARTTEVEFALVKDKTQAAQLAAYAVANSRERTGINVELGLYWSQYKVGDCVNVDLPEALLFNQKCIVIGRKLDADANTVTLMLRTENDAKHAWALGITGTAPPATTVTYPHGTGDVVAPTTDTAAVLRASYPKGFSASASDVGGGAQIHLNAFVMDYASTPPVEVNVPAGDIPGLSYGSTYYLFADVTGPGDAAPTYGATTVYGNAVNSSTHPNRIYLNYTVDTPASGGTATTGGGTGGGYGGASYCVTTDTPILMADGTQKQAGALVVGDRVRTQHEATLEWGDFTVEAARIVQDMHVFRATIGDRELRGTARHRVFVDGEWRQLREIGAPDGKAAVVKLTVAGAHTYVSNGVLSHNIKTGQLP